MCKNVLGRVVLLVEMSILKHSERGNNDGDQGIGVKKFQKNTKTNDGNQGFHVEVAYSIVFFAESILKKNGNYFYTF